MAISRVYEFEILGIEIENYAIESMYFDARNKNSWLNWRKTKDLAGKMKSPIRVWESREERDCEREMKDPYNTHTKNIIKIYWYISRVIR